MKGKKKTAKEPAAKKVVRAEPGLKPCGICNGPRQSGKSELETAGGFYRLDKDQYFHYFCLLFSTNAKQRGDSDEGINGFLQADIKTILSQNQKSKCSYCSNNNATARCLQCQKRYHYTCGKSKGVTFRYHTQKSLCSGCIPKFNFKPKHSDADICMAGCLEKVQAKDAKMVSSCCHRLYHIDCLQSLSSNAGRTHFKCPMCKDQSKFTKSAQDAGVYIPEKDADWELPEQENFYNFQQMGELYSKCDAEPCWCTKGAKYSLPGTRFEIIRCAHCGSSALHIFCGKLSRKAPYYVCKLHDNALEDVRKFQKNVEKRKEQEGLDSDDEAPIDDSHLIKPGYYKDLEASKKKASSSSTSKQPSVSKNTARGSGLASNTSRKRNRSKSDGSTSESRKSQQPNPPIIQGPINKVRPAMTRPQAPKVRTQKPVVLDLSSSSSSGDEEEDEIMVTDVVKVPFRLQNPTTLQATIMPVGPIGGFDLELSPTFNIQEGLNLQVSQGIQRLQKKQQQTSPKAQSTADTSTSQIRITNVFSQRIDEVDLCSDSD